MDRDDESSVEMPYSFPISVDDVDTPVLLSFFLGT